MLIETNMESNKKVKAPRNLIDPASPLYKPGNYKEMDVWLNALSRQAWLAVLGSYVAGGNNNVIQFLRDTYPMNIELWKDKDLSHFFNCRNWGEFRSRNERS